MADGEVEGGLNVQIDPDMLDCSIFFKSLHQIYFAESREDGVDRCRGVVGRCRGSLGRQLASYPSGLEVQQREPRRAPVLRLQAAAAPSRSWPPGQPPAARPLDLASRPAPDAGPTAKQPASPVLQALAPVSSRRRPLALGPGLLAGRRLHALQVQASSIQAGPDAGPRRQAVRPARPDPPSSSRKKMKVSEVGVLTSSSSAGQNEDPNQVIVSGVGGDTRNQEEGQHTLSTVEILALDDDDPEEEEVAGSTGKRKKRCTSVVWQYFTKKTVVV
ncbi:hypothetical protein E2562_021306 [Oryza meyeriana var. granulata]|uniref:Uncharacterized protein n=1 Tax=Oryza meyeriana var. granulata TaxID=110450 RepID=A0A6G1C0A2_9ORYZ|nr:hypothetical protein E2562_021306 [Oryza meyeriana var. granulata]